MKWDHARAMAAYIAAFGEPYGWPSREEMSLEQQKEFVLVTFWDLLGEEDEEHANWSGVFEYMEHCGIDLEAIRTDPKAAALSSEDVVLAHYRLKDGRYDLDRVVSNYITQPRILDHIAALEAERQTKKDHRRNQQRESKRRHRRQRGRQLATG